MALIIIAMGLTGVIAYTVIAGLVTRFLTWSGWCDDDDDELYFGMFWPWALIYGTVAGFFLSLCTVFDVSFRVLGPLYRFSLHGFKKRTKLPKMVLRK